MQNPHGTLRKKCAMSVQQNRLPSVFRQLAEHWGDLTDVDRCEITDLLKCKLGFVSEKEETLDDQDEEVFHRGPS